MSYELSEVIRIEEDPEANEWELQNSGLTITPQGGISFGLEPENDEFLEQAELMYWNEWDPDNGLYFDPWDHPDETAADVASWLEIVNERTGVRTKDLIEAIDEDPEEASSVELWKELERRLMIVGHPVYNSDTRFLVWPTGLIEDYEDYVKEYAGEKVFIVPKEMTGHGYRCPNCGDPDGLMGPWDNTNFEGDEVSQDTRCTNCGVRVASVYTLDRHEVWTDPERDVWESERGDPEA